MTEDLLPGGLPRAGGALQVEADDEDHARTLAEVVLTWEAGSVTQRLAAAQTIAIFTLVDALRDPFR